MTDEPLFLRYYLRMPHNVGTPIAQDTIEAYTEIHAIIRELPYKMWIRPRQIDTYRPGRTSDHYVMFVTIMISREEEFNKVLFELALKYGIQVCEKIETDKLNGMTDDVET